MTQLDGAPAFEALERLLSGHDDGTSWKAVSPSIERLRKAITDHDASALDLAVLLRQAIARESARRLHDFAPMVMVDHSRFASFTGWETVGLKPTETSRGTILSYTPWCPDWLDSDAGSIDGLAASELRRREFNSVVCKGDPMLAAVGRQSYRSRGQRAAVRAALSTPPGAALVVALPTGEGKSMVFQLIHKVGFAGSPAGTGHGVTLVVVPTVALGINHEREAVDLCGLPLPLAFQGGKDSENQAIAEKIANGTQGLCFASPEAACGRLRDPLRQAAIAGNLRAIVIDEAHLVDQWGTGFRTEYQELSALRAELVTAAPEAMRPRTIMLSATLTDSSESTLKSLFGSQGTFGTISAVQLRPEPDYWVSPVEQEVVRESRVLEALFHLPRPLVLYVTKVKAAEHWLSFLRGVGYSRVRALHGSTTTQERENIVESWRDGELDIVVGTSAFGLGIDYAHARSVVHACVPETLDRFYQEVGRGGRDGLASLSLILPATSDFRVARKLNVRKVISVKRGLERWRAMFNGKRNRGSGRIAVRVDGRPGSGDRDIDMSGKRNTDWNLRILTLMARAGMVRLLGTPDPRIEEPGDWLELELLDDHHRDTGCWEQKVQPLRKDIRAAGKRNLALMERFLEDARCPAQVFEELYGIHRVAHQCSRCRTCRADPQQQKVPRQVGEPRSPWILPRGRLMASLLGESNSVLIGYDTDALRPRKLRRLSTAIERLQRDGLAKALLLGSPPSEFSDLLAFAAERPLFVADVPTLAQSRLPKGPELVIVGEGHSLSPQNIRANPESPRMFLAPTHCETAELRPLKEVFEGRRLDVDEFIARVSQ